MSLLKFEIGFLKTVFVLAAIQGTTWTILSLICINPLQPLHVTETPETYSGILPFYLYYRYIRGFPSSEGPDLFVVRPQDLIAFLWFYFFGSALWVLLSIYVRHAIRHNKQHLPLFMSGWSILVFLLSLVDVILMSLLARDYNACTDKGSNSFCFLTNGIGFTIAARGFLLWLLNVGAAIIILYYGIKLYREFYLTKAVRIPRARLANENNDWSKGPNSNHSESPNFESNPPVRQWQENLPHNINEVPNSNYTSNPGQQPFSVPNQPMSQRREHLPGANNQWLNQQSNQNPSRHVNSERFDAQRHGY